MPDSDSLLLLTFDGSLLLTGSAGQSATALGSAIAIDGTAQGAAGTAGEGSTQAIVRRTDAMVVIDLADASETPVVAAQGVSGLLGAVLPVPGGGTVRTIAPVDASGIPIGTTIAFVTDDGTADVLFDAASTDAVLQTCVSPSGRYAAVLVAPDAASNPYDRYQLPLPGKVETHVIDIASADEVTALTGFDISWCRLPPG